MRVSVTHEAEVRVTPWVHVHNRPEWLGTALAAYRIWQRASIFGWEQRHEWKRVDGRTVFESWIRGLPHWLADVVEPDQEDEITASS